MGEAVGRAYVEDQLAARGGRDIDCHRRVEEARGHQYAERRTARGRHRYRRRLKKRGIARATEAGHHLTAQRPRDQRNVRELITRGGWFVGLCHQHARRIRDEHPGRLKLLGGLERLIEDIVATALGDQRAKIRALHENACTAGEATAAAGEELRHQIRRLFERAGGAGAGGPTRLRAHDREHRA